MFISDIKLIVSIKALLFAFLSPFVLILLLLFVYPLFSGLTRTGNGLIPGCFYSLTAITVISAIPFIYGLVFSYIHLYEPPSPNDSSVELIKKEAKNILNTRIAVSAFLSFIILLPAIFLTDAVSTEGWLRSICASFLMAMMAPFIFLFVVGFARDRKKGMVLSVISIMFLVTVPSGLMLHHPWSYFAFFSPFYWISWAWVVASPAESLIYGAISVLITSAGMLIFYRCILKNNRS